MRDQHGNSHLPLERVLCESDLGFELLDMLAQANIDFRRLPAEELQRLLAKSRSTANARPNHALQLVMA